MSNPFRALLLLGAALLLGAGNAAANEPLTLYFRAAITIEPDGTLSRLEWEDADKIPAAVRTRLDERVTAWEFEPGTVDGDPAATDSTLRVTLEAEADGQALVLRVLDAGTGARLAPHPVARYPAKAIRSHEEAALLARLEVAPDGMRTVHIDEYVGDGRLRDEFTESVEAMFTDVDVTLELVEGRPVPASFRMPVTFCIGQPVCHEDAFPEAGDDTAGQPGEATPMDSVARLVTDVRGREI